MKPSKFPLMIWLGALPFFVAHIWLSARGLPPKVATHFNAAGQPDGWMTRETHTISFIILGLGMSTFIVGCATEFVGFPKRASASPIRRNGKSRLTVTSRSTISSTIASGLAPSLWHFWRRSITSSSQPMHPKQARWPHEAFRSAQGFSSPESFSGYSSWCGFLCSRETAEQAKPKQAHGSTKSSPTN